MEEKENSSSGGIAISVSGGEEAPESYRLAPRTESPNPPAQFGVVPAIPAQQQASPATGTVGPEVVKKKRGRPRKYGPDGTVSLALSPMPISASIPLSGGEFSTWKRGRGRPSNAESAAKKSHLSNSTANANTTINNNNSNNTNKYEVYESPGQGQSQSQVPGIAYSVGANFTPHVLTVNAGEDVTMKVMTFSQQGARAICILSANGTISNVTLRQPTTSGGTLTYEGRFEILSLSGSYMPTEIQGTKSRSGGMSVSLAGPDGRVVGGGLAGLLVAAGPVQVVVGSFLPGHNQEHHKPKKQRIEMSMSSPPPPPIIAATVSSGGGDDSRVLYGAIKPIVTPATAFNLDGNNNNSSPLNPIQGYRNPAPESLNNNNSTSLPEEEPKSLTHSNCEVSC